MDHRTPTAAGTLDPASADPQQPFAAALGVELDGLDVQTFWRWVPLALLVTLITVQVGVPLIPLAPLAATVALVFLLAWRLYLVGARTLWLGAAPDAHVVARCLHVRRASAGLGPWALSLGSGPAWLALAPPRRGAIRERPVEEARVLVEIGPTGFSVEGHNDAWRLDRIHCKCTGDLDFDERFCIRGDRALALCVLDERTRGLVLGLLGPRGSIRDGVLVATRISPFFEDPEAARRGLSELVARVSGAGHATDEHLRRRLATEADPNVRVELAALLPDDEGRDALCGLAASGQLHAAGLASASRHLAERGVLPPVALA